MSWASILNQSARTKSNCNRPAHWGQKINGQVLKLNVQGFHDDLELFFLFLYLNKILLNFLKFNNILLKYKFYMYKIIFSMFLNNQTLIFFRIFLIN